MRLQLGPRVPAERRNRSLSAMNSPCIGVLARPARSNSQLAAAAAGCFDDAFALSEQFERYIGPVRVCSIEGKDRGVIATEQIQPGQLLLCCEPLGVLTGPQAVRLPVEQLQVELASRVSPRLAAWAHQLYDGSSSSTLSVMDLSAPTPAAAAAAGGGAVSDNSYNGHMGGHEQQQQQQLQEQQQYWQRQQLEFLVSSSSSSSSSQPPGGPYTAVAVTPPAAAAAASTTVAPAVTDAVLQRLMDVVRYNAYGDLHDDLAAAAAAGCEAVSHLGLWAEFSLINHSCVPNAINWVLPGEPRAMAVRATSHIKPGSEVTISYLGAPQLLPLPQRREALAGGFGFRCSCSRCRGEEDIPDSLADLMQDIVSRCSQSFDPRLQRARAAGDVPALSELRHQAASMMGSMYSQLRRHLVHPVRRQQLLSSVYPCLQLIADADSALADHASTAASLGRCLSAAAAVTPGSDLHCIVAARLAELQQQLHGPQSPESAAAWQACCDAHSVRYGRLGEARVRQLAELNRTLYD